MTPLEQGISTNTEWLIFIGGFIMGASTGVVLFALILLFA